MDSSSSKNSLSAVEEAKEEKDFWDSWPAMNELRPNLLKSEFAGQLAVQRKEGYRVLVIRDENSGRVVSFLGFRVLNFLFSGKTLYIDDLYTIEEFRGQGAASHLLDKVIKIAKEETCRVVTLDSGYGETRTSAHRLYLNKGFSLASHHFSYQLP